MKEKEEIIMIVENAANQIKLAIQRGIAINTPQLMIITECNQEIEKARKNLLELTNDKEFIEEEIKGLKFLLIRWMNGYLVGVNKIAKENKSHILGNVLSQYQLLNKEGTPAKAIKNGGLTIVDTSKKDLFLANQGISNLRDLMTNPTEGGVGRYVDYGKKIREELLSLQEKYAEDPSAFIDAKGNKKNLRLMAEIKVRYDLISDDLKGKDVKYVMASSHPNASERCSWWQGKLFKVDIDVESRQMHQYVESKSQALCKPLPQSEWVDNVPTYSLKTAIECGFLSYNCQHRLIKYYKGVKAPQYDLITVEKKRNLTSYQRALENKIRKTKLIEKVNGRNYPIERKNVFTGEMQQMTAVEYSKMLQNKYEDFCQKNGLVQYTWRLRITMEERGNK